MPYLALVVSGSPLTVRAPDIAAAAVVAGWQVRVVATPSALAWLDAPAVRQVTGAEPLVEQRGPDEPKRFPTPDAVLVCPATFNLVAKVAAGIMDNYATGLVCEAVASDIPLIMVPTVSTRLWGHPAWERNVNGLMLAGVRFIDARTGAAGWPTPTDPDGAAQLGAAFDPGWVIRAP
jgi:phosphopantothenoylcysteine decarboxylase